MQHRVRAASEEAQEFDEEPVLYPEIPIVDAHHHLYDRRELRYLLPDFLKDLKTDHNVRSTVFVQARSMYRDNGPAALRPVGETEFARSVAEQVAADPSIDVMVCEAIVGYADLRMGEGIAPVLDAHIEAGGGRFRGVRHIVAWDADSSLLNPAYPTSPELMESPDFREGFAELGRAGLSFDAWLFFHQLDQLGDLARAFPDTAIVLNHCGGIIGVGRYGGQREQVFSLWKRAITNLARCENVSIKIGGFGMELVGFRSEQSSTATARELASGWRPWVETCIEAFGTSRCMFESNFPVDRSWINYEKAWNAMKWLALDASADEKNDLFWRSASNFYRLHSAEETARRGFGQQVRSHDETYRL